jgi:hypothetical protein
METLKANQALGVRRRLVSELCTGSGRPCLISGLHRPELLHYLAVEHETMGEDPVRNLWVMEMH